MKRIFIIIAALALGFCSCDSNKNQTQNQDQIQIQTQTNEPVPEEVLSSTGDLNGDGIDDLVVNVNNARFDVYFKDHDGVYNLQYQGKSFDEWTEITAYIKDGNLMVYAFTESSKDYTFHYDDSGHFRLIAFDQFMNWPDGGGSYSQSFDFVNGKRTVQEDDDPAKTFDLPQIPLRVIEEIHFGNISEIEDLYE